MPKQKIKRVEAVAISANTGGPLSRFTREASKVIELAMSEAVTKAYADGKTDPQYVRKRMMEAREQAKKFLEEAGMTQSMPLPVQSEPE